MNTEYKNGLQAPTVPVANADGLINTAHLDKPLRVNVLLWEGIRPGYFVQLLLDGVLVGDIKVISDQDQPGDTVHIQLASEYWQNEGHYQLGFRATNDVSLISNDSPSTPIVIDRTAAGASLLAPMIFPNVTMAENLRGTVPGYTGMQTGDIIQSLCNGVEGATHRITAENMTSQKVEVTFRREFLQGLGGDEIIIEYHVTDRAGNQSMTAQPVKLSLQL